MIKKVIGDNIHGVLTGGNHIVVVVLQLYFGNDDASVINSIIDNKGAAIVIDGLLINAEGNAAGSAHIAADTCDSE